MNSLKPLAEVRDITGEIIQLGMFESIRDYRREPGRVSIAINRAQVRELVGSYVVTQTGVTLYTFTLIEGKWHLGTFTTWADSEPQTILRNRRF